VSRSRSSATDPGQATVEFALVLPLLAAFILTFVDVVSIARDQVLTDYVARDAARTASTATDINEANDYVTRLTRRVGRPDLTWSMDVDTDFIEVRIWLTPRASMLMSSMKWLGAPARVTGRAVFPTEYDVIEE